MSSIQCMSETPIHVGGLTALEMFGFGHYLSNAKRKTVHLYSEGRLPNWLGKVLPECEFQTHSIKKMWLPEFMDNSKFLREHVWRNDLPNLLASIPEKAYLEILQDVPKKMSFEHADELMQGLTSLSPRKLDQLLHSCLNIKVKRLFFWFAKRQNYKWYQKIDMQDFDLGKGKRLIAQGGKLDKDLLITVPEHMYGPE